MRTSPKIKELSSAKPAAKEKAGREHSFIDRVFEIARQIPHGRVTSYGAIAEASGIRLSARMVGWAMHAAGSAHQPVPAHRVVNSKGLLTGKHHFATPTLMQELLENEGIKVEDNQVQDFKKLFWDPMEANGMKRSPAAKGASKASAKTATKPLKTAATGTSEVAIKAIESATTAASKAKKAVTDSHKAVAGAKKAIATVKADIKTTSAAKKAAVTVKASGTKKAAPTVKAGVKTAATAKKTTTTARASSTSKAGIKKTSASKPSTKKAPAKTKKKQ